MDTKLKSSKKFSFIIAGTLIALAVIAYMACYPVCKGQINSYFSESFRNEQLLYCIYQSNLVLYKDISDKAEKTNYSFSDLYLRLEEKNLPEETDYSVRDYEETRNEELKADLENGVNTLLDEWKSEMLSGLAKGMDYLAVDHKTGEMIKNTERDIQKLYEGTMTEEENPYVYYVKIAYDKAGNIFDISVLDEKPDELLKNVQSVMASEALTKILKNRSSLFSEYYIYDDAGNPKKLSASIDENPKDVTFIYALTKEQKANINSSRSGYNFVTGSIQNARMEYIEAGAGSIYALILIVLGIAALLLTRSKRYCLHELTGCRMHLEISLCACFCLVGFGTIAVDLMAATNNNYFPQFYSTYAEFLPAVFYPVVTVLVNVVILALVFGAWYYLITTFGELFSLGFKSFLRERSLIVQFLSWAVNGMRSRKDKLKEELLHTDLGGDVDQTLRKFLLINYFILAVISFMWAFGWAILVVYSVLLYIAIKKYIGKIQQQYRKLLAATGSIAEGNLNTTLSDDLGVFESYKGELNKIQDGFRKAVDEEVKSQKMKTELITNVSHDLKTPLTAITTYIELLEDETISEEQRKEYLGVLKKKSARLKFLIEDLFEVSKASSGNVVLNPVDVDICNLMRQVYLEYEDKACDANLIFRFTMPEEKVILKLDSQKTYRVFENLYINIIKYAMPKTRVYVKLERTEKAGQKKGIRIELKNMSAMELNVAPDELTERFVRGDSSRNTEGSGLGLAIARSFVELQGGELKIEIDGDLFKVVIEW